MGSLSYIHLFFFDGTYVFENKNPIEKNEDFVFLHHKKAYIKQRNIRLHCYDLVYSIESETY